MNLISPLPLGLSSRVIEYRHRFGLCVSGFLHVPFEQGERGRLWGQQSMWQFAAGEMAPPLLDEGVAKLTPEFLVHGWACPPAGSDDTACAVRVRLGGAAKLVYVFGDRFWQGGTPTAPRPFRRMALGWPQAYGGPGFDANPHGKGHGDAGQALPNLELPVSRLTQRGQVVAPAGFGVLDVMHPQRAAWRGTYDDAWMKEHAPGFAPDLDWRHFNMAPQDQWLGAPLRGDEPFVLEHLHPDRPQIEGRLPGLRVRAFACYAPDRDGAEPKWREVPMRLTTVWFFPHAERLILVFHGLAECTQDDAADISALLGAVERLGEARADAHYLAVVDKRNDPVDGAVESLNDADLLPEGLDCADPAFEQAREAFKIEGLQGEAQWRRAELDVALMREELKARGMYPDAMGVQMPVREKIPSVAELPAYLKAKRKEMEAMEWAALDDMVTHLLDMLGAAEQQGVDLAQLVHRGPPDCDAAKQLNELVAKARRVGQELNAEELLPKFQQAEFSQRLGYLQLAHTQPPAFPLQGEAAASSRAEMEWMLAHGLRMFPGMDFTGADLARLDLRGADFSGAWLESANLSGANVSGANFTAAVLAHADLRNTVAVGADFTGANLGRARLAGAVFDQANLDGAMLMHCSFAQTQLRRARLGQANLLESTWGAADWTGVVGPGALFYRFDLRELRLQEAELAGATFVECDLSDANLQAAHLQAATFLTCRMDGVQLGGANLEGAVFAKECSVRGADLRHARMARVNFGACDWSGSHLAHAVLDGALLSEADLSRCDVRLASLRAVIARKTRLCGARVAGTDLRDAVLQHADLRGADLRRASLFGADLSRVRLDGAVRLEGGLLTRARSWPRLSPQQQAEYAARHPTHGGG